MGPMAQPWCLASGCFTKGWHMFFYKCACFFSTKKGGTSRFFATTQMMTAAMSPALELWVQHLANKLFCTLMRLPMVRGTTPNRIAIIPYIVPFVDHQPDSWVVWNNGTVETYDQSYWPYQSWLSQINLTTIQTNIDQSIHIMVATVVAFAVEKNEALGHLVSLRFGWTFFLACFLAANMWLSGDLAGGRLTHR